MDIFRQEQKKLCKNGSKNKRGTYGCSCCRDISNLNIFKKFSRKLAKIRLRRKDEKMNINDE